MIRVCFHGAESTGKSTLAEQLAAEFSCPLLAEYGRTYAETVSTEFTMEALLTIARAQDRSMRAATASHPALALLDTDPLMTAAWSQMLFNHIPDELLRYEKAELYLLFAPDVPWIFDGTRFFGLEEARMEFSKIAEDLLRQAGVSYRTISGDWAAREALAREAIAAALG
jgi:NadR type nicotinamide-nucleotide adenylyltransferase